MLQILIIIGQLLYPTDCITQIIELIIFERIEGLLVTTDNRFGFKSKHSTDMCVYAFRQTIDYYNSHGNPVFICFLDASKAFDRVNHYTLFNKLITRKVPGYILRLLVNWYSQQRYCVQWGEVISGLFSVSNGVKQG